MSTTTKKTRKYNTLLDNVSPFHMIGLTILNDVSPLASGCAEDPRASEICGKMTPVPAIFLEYLGENETTQRWKNFGWNTFNVAITIGTLGEGAGAITAIRAAKDGTRVAIAIKNSVKLFDFAYSVADITAELTESGPYGCANLETEEERQECREKWEAWKYVSYALATKGGVDLATGLAKSAAKVSRYSVEELREFIRATELKKNNTELDQAEIDEIITQLEDIIQRNGLQDEYQAALRGIDDLANAVVKFTTKQLDDFVLLATKQGDQTKVMLGKYLDGGPNSYIQRAGIDHTYFDLGSEKWKEAEALVNKNADEMWKINKKFIDEQKALNKEFYFSQEPWKAQSHEYLSKEAEYLIELGAKDFQKINANTWKVIW